MPVDAEQESDDGVGRFRCEHGLYRLHCRVGDPGPMRGESASVAQLANALKGGMQAVECLGQTLADFGRSARFSRQKRQVAGRGFEEFQKIIAHAKGDRPLAEHGAAGALDECLSEIEGEAGVFYHRPLDTLHLLLDIPEPASDCIARAVHDEGSGGGFRHQTALVMDFSIAFTRSSPEMSLGSSVSRRAARVRDWIARRHVLSTIG